MGVKGSNNAAFLFYLLSLRLLLFPFLSFIFGLHFLMEIIGVFCMMEVKSKERDSVGQCGKDSE